MSQVPTHDYQCPCDMCEPEAHSVAEYRPCDTAEQTGGLDFYGASPTRRAPSRPNIQDLTWGHARKQSRPTLPASSKADLEVAAFESLVKQVGEGKARWSKLLELLEDQSKAG